MKRHSTFAAVALAAVAVVPIATAEEPVVPFPSARAGKVFVAAQTVTTGGAVSNSFAPGSTVVFRAYAVERKTRRLVTKKTAKSFSVTIPSQPSVKLAYTPKAKVASGRYAWIGRWKVPADYAAGVVAFKVVVKTKTKGSGSFSQAPVASAQLTITATPQVPFGNGPLLSTGPSGSKPELGLYVDTVNGTRPSGAPPRPVGCTQTNVYKRGEQLVLRAWGFDLATGAILSVDNVTDAHYSLPGVANIPLNWGAHGATGAKVWFWANQWSIPKDYPFGDVAITIQYTTTTGKKGTFSYPITIIP